jgi:hypothetical protein
VSESIFNVTILTGAVAAAAFALVVVADEIGLPLAAFSAVVLLASKRLAVDAAARRAAPSCGVIATTFGIVGLAPLVIAGCLIDLSETLHSPFRFGLTADAGTFTTLGFWAFVITALGTMLAAFVFAPGPPTMRRPELCAVAILSTLATGLLVVFSLVRLANFAPIDSYGESLPVIATVPPILRPASIVSPPSGDAVRDRAGVHAHRFGEFVIYRECAARSCRRAIAHASAAWDADDWATRRWSREPGNVPIVVQGDLSHDLLWIREGRARSPYLTRDPPDPLSGPSPPEGYLSYAFVHPSDVADAASPYLPWIIGGAVSLVVCVLLLVASVQRGREMRARADLHAWTIAVASFGGAPLVAAALVGLVFG